MAESNITKGVENELLKGLCEWLEQDYGRRYKALIELVESKDQATDLALQADRTGIAERVVETIHRVVLSGELEKAVERVLKDHAAAIAAAYLGLEKDALSMYTVRLRNEKMQEDIIRRAQLATEQWIAENGVFNIEEVFTSKELKALRDDIKARFKYRVGCGINEAVRARADEYVVKVVGEVIEEVLKELAHG